MKGGMIVGPSGKEMDEYQAECDLRTLIEAEKIKADKKRIAAAMKKKAEMQKALTSIDKSKGK